MQNNVFKSLMVMDATHVELQLGVYYSVTSPRRRPNSACEKCESWPWMAFLKVRGVGSSWSCCSPFFDKTIRLTVNCGGGAFCSFSETCLTVGLLFGSPCQHSSIVPHISSDSSNSGSGGGFVGFIPFMTLYITVASRGNS